MLINFRRLQVLLYSTMTDPSRSSDPVRSVTQKIFFGRWYSYTYCITSGIEVKAPLNVRNISKAVKATEGGNSLLKYANTDKEMVESSNGPVSQLRSTIASTRYPHLEKSCQPISYYLEVYSLPCWYAPYAIYQLFTSSVPRKADQRSEYHYHRHEAARTKHTFSHAFAQTCKSIRSE